MLNMQAGWGTGAFARRETWRPESRLAWQPCRVHATVHQVMSTLPQSTRFFVRIRVRWRMRMGMSKSSFNRLLKCVTVKTKDYNEKREFFAASSWNSPSQKRSPTLGDSYTWPEIRWWLCAHSHDSLNIILKGWEQKRKTAATAPPSSGRSSGMGQQISQCFYNW